MAPRKFTDEQWRLARERDLRGEPIQDDDVIRKLHLHQSKHIRYEFLSTRTLPDLPDENAFWYWGPGAFERAQAEHPNAFIKTADKYWNGYYDDEVVITECFFKTPPRSEVRQWGERYPFRAEVRGRWGTMMIRPKLVIVTSDRHPGEFWKDDPHMLGGLEWRYKIVEVQADGKTALT